ncbi:MAG TPA: GntR family transcriptional regulator [Bacteroidales bacterium]|nr:GntR family transcriptional regulator [Bacteroidales bacterium]
MNFITIHTDDITPIYEQLRESITLAIEKGVLRMDERLPSINQLCREFSISPGTVLRAYDDLCRSGILGSKRGKGYYVLNTKITRKLNIFVLFDRISSYKEVLYDAFHNRIGADAAVQVFFHHYDDERFRSMIEESVGKYNYYVIMPHFNHDVSPVLDKIPREKLLIIDKTVPQLKGKYASICQNFREDIYKALTDAEPVLKKYKRLVFCKSANRFQFVPSGLIAGFEKFVHDSAHNGEVIASIKDQDFKTGDCFLVFPDSDLIYIIKEAKNQKLKIGKDIGLIAYDDSPMREILEGGISVISTDFEAMGNTAAEMILTGSREKLFNPCRFIRRKSL